jgi:hypothetical protein
VSPPAGVTFTETAPPLSDVGTVHSAPESFVTEQVASIEPNPVSAASVFVYLAQ